MKLKLVNEQFYKTKSLLAAQKYLDTIEFKRSAISLPALLSIVGIISAMAIMLFFR